MIQGSSTSEKRGKIKVTGAFTDSSGGFLLSVRGSSDEDATFSGRIDKDAGTITGVWNLKDGDVGDKIKGQEEK
jgi:hypothetical protein